MTMMTMTMVTMTMVTMTMMTMISTIIKIKNDVCMDVCDASVPFGGLLLRDG